MQMWKCDVCGDTAEALTSLSDFTLMPRGWRWRTGRVPSKTSSYHELRLHVCSDDCAKKYDRVEAEEIGFQWQISRGNVSADLKDPPHKAGKDERPLKAK